MRLASEAAPVSSLPIVLMVPQPVNQIELTKTPHLTKVQDLRMCISFRFAAIKKISPSKWLTSFDPYHQIHHTKRI
jgi:hypothetical protein